MSDKTEAKQDRTLNELINGRIVDAIYSPRDNNVLCGLLICWQLAIFILLNLDGLSAVHFLDIEVYSGSFGYL